MPKDTTIRPVRKPRKDFPLTPHASGKWCKKVRGKLFYFGRVGDPNAALDEWLAVKDDLLAGRTPRFTDDGLTVRDLVNRFLTMKKGQVTTHEITQRHFDDLFSTCETIVAAFGKTRLVTDLRPNDFEQLRSQMAETRGAWALGSQVQRTRSLFKYAYDAELIERTIRFGPGFKRPGKAAIRRERANKPPRLFEPAELRQLIESAGLTMRAMILLGINCGFGNSDVGRLPMKALDLKGGWVNFPRPKTGISRRCPLWPETVEALRAAIAERPIPKDDADKQLVFVTKYGKPWAKNSPDSPVTKEFTKLLTDLELRRPGLSFYALRHTTETIGGETLDQVAVNAIMGHADSTMAAEYRERIEDSRLMAVAGHIHAWLFPPKPKLAKSNPKKKHRKKQPASKTAPPR